MKLRTSCFNKTAFWKAITRFAPLWAVYFIGGVLIMLTVTQRSGEQAHHYSASFTAATIGYFAAINGIYAGLAAQLLFGDLFNSRMCNALHAMPLRRETWFFTHLLAGLAFSIVPNTLGILLILPRLGAFWFVAFLWLLGMTLEYLFFFGLAVFSMFCTGNRFAMVAVYGILNFASVIARWFCAVVFAPMLYGVSFPEKPFLLLCPVVNLAQNEQWVNWDWKDVSGKLYHREYFFDGLAGPWTYLWVIAAIGVALLAVSLLLYRRRKLESAGDFIAVQPLAPIFSVVFSLCAGAVFAMLGEITNSFYLPYLLVGTLVGYFGGQMLLQRRVKVFGKRTLLKAGVLLTTVFLTLAVVRLDPLGVTRWVPEEKDVASVTISDSAYYSKYNQTLFTAESTEDIQTVLALHQEIIAQGEERADEDSLMDLHLSYQLTNGSTVKRAYAAYLPTETIAPLKYLFSRPEVVLGYEDCLTNPSRIASIHIDSKLPLPKEAKASFLEAVAKDCENGNMAHSYMFHDNGGVKLWISAEIVQDNGTTLFREIRVFSDAENTIKWLADNTSLWYRAEDYGGITAEEFLKG